MKALYISWDGTGPDYLSALFFPIFAGLFEQGIRMHVLQFSWAPASTRERTRSSAQKLGIPYRSISVSRPRGSFRDAQSLLYGARCIRRYAKQHAIQVLVPRSLLPAAMALSALTRTGLELVYDADGFMADERVEYAGWSEVGFPYRFLRAVEASAVRRARAVVTRTAAAREILTARAGPSSADKIFVVPNGKDTRLFSPLSAEQRARIRAENGVAPETPWLMYAGSLGPQYLPAQMLRFFERLKLKRPDARFDVLTPQPALLTGLHSGQPLSQGVRVRSVLPEQVARLLAAADLGLAFRAPSFSQRGVSPIKLAEYLLCGLPVLASPIEELERKLASHNSALFLHDDSDQALDQAASWLIDDVLTDRDEIRERCRSAGIAEFGLPRVVAQYAAALAYTRPRAAKTP